MHTHTRTHWSTKVSRGPTARQICPPRSHECAPLTTTISQSAENVLRLFPSLSLLPGNAAKKHTSHLQRDMPALQTKCFTGVSGGPLSVRGPFCSRENMCVRVCMCACACVFSRKKSNLSLPLLETQGLLLDHRPPWGRGSTSLWHPLETRAGSPSPLCPRKKGLLSGRFPQSRELPVSLQLGHVLVPVSASLTHTFSAS